MRKRILIISIIILLLLGVGAFWLYGKPSTTREPLVLPQTMTPSTELITHKVSSEGIIGSAGGTISTPGRHTFKVSLGSLTGDFNFSISSYPRSQLSSSVPSAAPIYGNVEISLTPVIQGTTATADYLTILTVPLNEMLPAGSELIVLEQRLIGWSPNGDVARVDALGATATFQTRSVGLLLLVRQKDRGIENAP